MDQCGRLLERRHAVQLHFLRQQKTEGRRRMAHAHGGAGYDKLLKSRIRYMKNMAFVLAGSITAAQFLPTVYQRRMPWIHLDIAGLPR